MTQAGTEAILRQAAEAMSRRDGATARQLLGSLRSDSLSPASLFLLAQACRMDGDEPAEASAIEQLLRVQPFHLGALLMKGAALARGGNDDEAMTIYQLAISVARQVTQRGERLPPMLTAEVDRAAQWVDHYTAERLARIDEALAKSGLGPGKRSERVDEALSILRGELPIQLQEPTSFYFPGLPQRSFYERGEFEWAAAVEDETATIKAELEALLAAQAEQFEPYVAADADRSSGTGPNVHLAGSTNWSAYHLLKGGQPVPGHAENFPATLAALERAPMPRIAGRSPMALFSLLKPGAHIRPHHGLFNFRLICHLPLIVPSGCTLRVGNQVRSWSEGEMLIFDDSMEHEARNQSDQQRIILLFEIWRPEISEADRQALTVLLEAANITAED